MPFSKTKAVNAAAERSSGEILVILDADTWIDPDTLRAAAADIAARRTPWVIPFTQVWRLRPDPTDRLLGADPTGAWPELDRNLDCSVVRPISLGLCYMLPRRTFDDVGGMDPRFAGWGGEDTAFKWALMVLHGKPSALPGPAYHLYHPRAQVPVWPGQTARNDALTRRYHYAARRGVQMRALCDEVRLLRDPDYTPPPPGRVIRYRSVRNGRSLTAVENTPRELRMRTTPDRWTREEPADATV